ncbi:MAG: endolytic transglycosylase MltG, partial [Elusimicrobia bacterium]|nr:endolytic transglycosylase MltG [Elusimicrobiota bacterium]
AGALAWALRPGAPVTVEIPEGLPARQTVELLGRKGVVVSVPLFRAYLRLTGADRRLKPGRYTFRARELPWTVLRKLTLGQTDEIKVVIPEGFRASQIAERLAEAGVIGDAKAFESYVDDRGLEGRLFPSTYLFPPGYGVPGAVRAMTQAFGAQIGAAYAKADPKPTLSLQDALILASIVEREAELPPERPIIAAVYLNRLKKRMPLQADPTVQYALGYWKKGLTRKDLKIPSAYNTYYRYGLPPGPICSPGLSSFEAVLHPALTDALYFVADGRGGHIFSETNAEQSEAARLYKHELRKQKEELRREERAGKAAAPR